MAERPLTAKKGLGAYYTDPQVVEFLVGWAASVSPGVLMDPACGDGRFLAVACERGATRVIGCDLDPAAVQRARETLVNAIARVEVTQADFFAQDPTSAPPVDAIVGNPPFIRFQRFAGESRARALRSSLRVGARLSQLTASWAPFLLHALQFLRSGGALAMVVPAELAQTAYGVVTLQALCRNFARIRLITFRRNWFADAQQETFLLLAEHRGGRCSSAELIPLDTIRDLAGGGLLSSGAEAVKVSPDEGIALGLAYLGHNARAAWEATATNPCAKTLKGLGDIANGYVSGANAFFHRTLAQAATEGLPRDWLIPTARSIRSIKGLVFAAEDLISNEQDGAAHHLVLPRVDDLFALDRESLEGFIAAGEQLEIHKRYKCRVRNPWWQVPGLIVPDILLPYMIGTMPRCAVNRARAVYPNSLHGIRLMPAVGAERLAFGLLSTFSLLSMELAGRSYGGGVLKLEPSEMERILVIVPTLPEREFTAVFAEANRLLRAGDAPDATRLADQVLLKDQLGLPDRSIAALASGRAELVARRKQRSSRGS